MKTKARKVEELAQGLRQYMAIYHRQKNGRPVKAPGVYSSGFKSAVKVMGVTNVKTELIDVPISELDSKLETLKRTLKTEPMSKGMANNVTCSFKSFISWRELISISHQMRMRKKNKGYKLIVVSKPSQAKAAA